MTDPGDKDVVIVRHHVIDEVRQVPRKKKEASEVEEEVPKKWCWTRIQEAKQRNAGNTYKCWSEVTQILCETCGVCSLFVFENFLGIIFLILGVVYLNDCPIDRGIPISLLVYGVVSIVHSIVGQTIRWKWVDVKNKKDGFATCVQVVLVVTTIIYFVALIWGKSLCPRAYQIIQGLSLAAFSVFHWQKEVNTDNKNDEHYCNPVLFWVSFWTFVVMAIIGMILIVLLCFLCCIILANQTPSPEPAYVIVRQGTVQPSGQPVVQQSGQPVVQQSGQPVVQQSGQSTNTATNP